MSGSFVSWNVFIFSFCFLVYLTFSLGLLVSCDDLVKCDAVWTCRWVLTFQRKILTASIFRAQMKAVRSSETSIFAYTYTWHHNPEDNHRHLDHRENSKSLFYLSFLTVHIPRLFVCAQWSPATWSNRCGYPLWATRTAGKSIRRRDETSATVSCARVVSRARTRAPEIAVDHSWVPESGLGTAVHATSWPGSCLTDRIPAARRTGPGCTLACHATPIGSWTSLPIERLTLCFYVFFLRCLWGGGGGDKRKA